MTQVEPYLFVR